MKREEALKMLAELVDSCTEAYDDHDMYMDLLKIVAEPKTGHWIDRQEGRWIYAKCSECGTVHDTQTNYCPFCGAKMESEATSGESYEGEFEAMEHNGRMDAVESDHD